MEYNIIIAARFFFSKQLETESFFSLG